MSDWYVLDENKKPVKVGLLEGAKAMEKSRSVAQTDVDNGEISVSTVFLGLDHSFGYGPPVLFETMIFGGPEDGYQERYTTWDEAVEGHKKAVKIASLPF